MEKQKSILGSVKVVILTLILVKLIGFVKQAVIAGWFGTSGSIDKFLLVSELMENLGAAVFSAIAVSFLTIYVETLSKKGREEANVLISNTFVVFLPFVIGVIVLLLLFADVFAKIVAPGYDSAGQAIISGYIRLFTVTFINMFVYYVCNAVLEAEKVFFPGKIVGVIRSISVIAAIICLSEKLGVNAMLVGVMAYYLLETCFVLFCIRKKFRFKVRTPFKDSRMKELLFLSFPLFVSYGVVQLQAIVDKAIASGLPDGSISTLSYGSYLYNTTHSILIGGLCTVIFSYFSTYVAEKRTDLVLETLYKYLKLSVALLILVACLYVGYSVDIVRIVYERGAFDISASKNVAAAFTAYSLGLVFIGIRDILIRVHYAYKDNRQAMINGIIGVAINIVMSIALSKILGFTGIALATTISSMCIAVLSCYTVKRNVKDFKLSKMGVFACKIVAAAVLTMISCFALNRINMFNVLLIDLIVKALASMSVYVIALKLMKCEELNGIKELIYSKIKKN